jgi:amino acid transporter
MVIGVVYVAQGNADFSSLVDFEADGNPVFALVAGVALAFFAMTGFENAANVAEETINPSRTFPRALVGGMIAAGVIYVLVAITAALTVPTRTLADSDAALLEVVKEGILPVPVGIMATLFAVIAMVAITNTTLVAVVTQSRILYGMAREDVVPGVFSKIHTSRRSPWVALIFSALVVVGLLLVGAALNEAGVGVDVVERLSLVTVVLTLVIYVMVILACLKLGDRDNHDESFRAPRPLLYVGILGNFMLLVYVVVDDPFSLVWCAGLLAVGIALYAIEFFFGRPETPAGRRPRS